MAWDHANSDRDPGWSLGYAKDTLGWWWEVCKDFKTLWWDNQSLEDFLALAQA
jgi:hypothetical protein